MLYSVVLVPAVQQCKSAISMCIYSPSLLSLPLLPWSHPSRSSQSASLSSLCCTAASHWLLILHWWCIYASVSLWVFPTLTFPCCIHKFNFYLCISIPALQKGSSMPFSFSFPNYLFLYIILNWIHTLNTEFLPILQHYGYFIFWTIIDSSIRLSIYYGPHYYKKLFVNWFNHPDFISGKLTCNFSFCDQHMTF